MMEMEVGQIKRTCTATYFLLVAIHYFINLPPPSPFLFFLSSEYTLMAFISHMGSSTMTGHYVCHIKKDEKWIIFNDNKVAESVAPPKEHAYLYFYKREQ